MALKGNAAADPKLELLVGGPQLTALLTDESQMKEILTVHLHCCHRIISSSES